MVDTSGVQQVGADILDKIVSGGIMVVGVIILGGIILALGLYIKHLRQFNVKVKIRSIRGRGSKGEPIYKVISDAGGFIENKKDKVRWFRLRGEKVDLPSPPLEALELDSKGVNHLNILQKSDTEYYYLLPDKITAGVVVRDGIDIPITQMSMKVVDGAVDYWGQMRKRDIKKMFDMESMLMKLLPYIIPVLMFMLVIFLTYLITDHWGEFASAAEALRQAAETLRDVSTAQVAIGG